jgi:hypothetical protein
MRSVKVGKFYKVTGRGLFDIIGGILNVGDVVQVVNPPGGRTGGQLRHVMNAKGEITFCNICFLEPYKGK